MGSSIQAAEAQGPLAPKQISIGGYGASLGLQNSGGLRSIARKMSLPDSDLWWFPIGKLSFLLITPQDLLGIWGQGTFPCRGASGLPDTGNFMRIR